MCVCMGGGAERGERGVRGGGGEEEEGGEGGGRHLNTTRLD